MSALTELHAGERQRVRFAALHLQHAELNAELHAAFERLLGSNAFTLGVEVEQFEAAFADYCQADHCVGVSSGTAALALMLRAYGIGTGDEVIVPAHTFIASALAVAHVGATPVLCDVREGTGLIDPEAARAAITPRTVAIMAVHLYGQACEMDALYELARPYGLVVLEDAAQAVGATYRGRRAGSLGAAACFSFYPGKNLGALGDGGAICTDDEMLATRLRRLRNLGQRAKGEHVELGYNERLDGLQAALLSVKLRHLDRWTEARRACAARYREALAPDVAVLEERTESPSVHHVFATRMAHRDRIAERLAGAGIETGIHYSRAVHQHDAWTGRPLRFGALPVAEAWAAQELSLPMHPDLEPHEIERVADALNAARSSMGV
ncbi:MAG TPA: DegT/DnrJ/EryC1/StrS family aminotransferase [Solirubrobacteraceae bacterium]|nr:DegT/DnrJ/EryC1/StrS family aminotransferase [Solirubrobacteraceae bacterium]